MNSTSPHESITSRFKSVVSRFADRTAIIAPGAEWTYAELDQHSSAIGAEILNRLGEISEPVALLMEHDAPLIAAILGTLKANKIYLALDPANPGELLAQMLADSGARLLLADKAHLSLANSLASQQMVVLEITLDLKSPSLPAKFPQVSPNAGAWLMYTSGSTGRPKGVWQNHRGMVEHAEVYAGLIQLTPHDRLSLLNSCSLSASGTTLFGALLNGATLCPFHVRSQGVERLAAWLNEKRITIYHSVPTVFRHLARPAALKRSFESVRLIRLGGEHMLSSDVETFRQLCRDDCLLVNSLSSTETGLISVFTIDQATLSHNRRVPVGRAVSGVEVLLVDENGLPVKAGSDGLIAIRGEHLRQGYWRQPEMTAETFKVDPLNPKTRIFISEDLGRFLPDGNLEHLGRADQLVKIRGQLVDLSEVESALMATGLVKEIAVTAPEDVSGERRLAAYIVPNDGAEASGQHFRRVLGEQLSDQMIPNDFVIMEELPQTPGGKIDKQALPPPRIKKGNSRSVQLPRDMVEKNLGRIWEEVLGIASIGMTDDFFELGGTSLQSVEVLLRIEGKFGMALPPSTLTECSTIEELALLLVDHAVIPRKSVDSVE